MVVGQSYDALRVIVTITFLFELPAVLHRLRESMGRMYRKSTIKPSHPSWDVGCSTINGILLGFMTTAISSEVFYQIPPYFPSPVAGWLFCP